MLELGHGMRSANVTAPPAVCLAAGIIAFAGCTLRTCPRHPCFGMFRIVPMMTFVQGSPQGFDVNFKRIVRVRRIGLAFQGGFAGQVLRGCRLRSSCLDESSRCSACDDCSGPCGCVNLPRPASSGRHHQHLQRREIVGRLWDHHPPARHQRSTDTPTLFLLFACVYILSWLRL